MFMIAGPNGAGKTTLYRTRIEPHSSAPFINADIIQRDELQDPSMAASYRAAELAEARRRDHLARGKSFVSESTFSHPSKLQLIVDAKEAGFRVVLYHVSVRSPDLSVRRVEQRFAEGGHDVPEDKVRERYDRNPALIREAALRSDRAYIYDNSALNRAPELHVKFREGQVIEASESVPRWARALYANELASYSPARLNPAAASFADAKAMAEKLGGDGVVTRIAEQRHSNPYTGRIVGETAGHWLQQTQPKTFVAHLKSNLGSDIRLHHSYEIRVTGSRRAAAVLLSPEPATVGAKMTKAEYASALRKLGGAAVGRIGLPMANVDYSGKIIQVSDTHIVQQVSTHVAIAHDVGKLSDGMQLAKRIAAGDTKGKAFDFRYDAAGGTASVALLQPIKEKFSVEIKPPETPNQKLKR